MMTCRVPEGENSNTNNIVIIIITINITIHISVRIRNEEMPQPPRVAFPAKQTNKQSELCCRGALRPADHRPGESDLLSALLSFPGCGLRH